MKQKTDETPDEWVRQMLTQLPDVPPPGSSFDSARLWTQLRPELQAKPTRRRMNWMGWLAAACLTGLVGSWFIGQPLTNESNPVATHRSTPKTDRPGIRPDQTTLTPRMDASAPVVAGKLQRKAGQKSTDKQDLAPSIDPAFAASEATAPLPDSTAVAVATTLADKLPESRKPNVAAVTPKRRFRVMHENELRSEEEAAPKLYRTDTFVRLGTGQRNDNVTDNRQPTLVMPLTNHSNQ